MLHGWRRGADGDRTREKRATDIKPVMTQIRVLVWTVVWALAVVGTEGFSLPPPAGLTSVTAGRMPGPRWSAGTGARLGHAAGRSAFPFERRASFVRRAVGLQRRGGAAAARASAAASPPAGVRYGFVGVGTMSTAIVRGICTQDAPPCRGVVLSPRGAENAAALLAEFPALVSVAADNQAVVDQADVVFIGVLPKDAEGVCRALEFAPRHTVVSLVSTTPMAVLEEVYVCVEIYMCVCVCVCVSIYICLCR